MRMPAADSLVFPKASAPLTVSSATSTSLTPETVSLPMDIPCVPEKRSWVIVM